MNKHFLADKHTRFSIRKLSTGICSVAIGHLLLVTPHVQAEELPITNNETVANETETPVTAVSTNNKNETMNLVLDRPVTTSGVESGTSFTQEKAFDNNPDTRYSAAKMKNDTKADSPQTPQWLQVDLGAKAEIDSIKVDFYRKVYATEYTIESSKDGESDWKVVATRNELQPSASTLDPSDNITFDTPIEVDRHLRFNFKRINHHAGGNAVSVKDIAVNGRLLEKIAVPINPLKKLQNANIAIDGDYVRLTGVEDDDQYTYEVIGSANKYVVDNSGKIADYRLNDLDVTLLVAARSRANNEIVAESKVNKIITIPAKHTETVTGTNAKPLLALDIQEFLAGEGTTHLAASDTIYVDPAFKKQTDLFNEDLKHIIGFDLKYGTEKDSKIKFHLTDQYNLKDEGYLMRIGDTIDIYANDAKAFNYASVTLAQMLQKEEALTKGVYRDYPNYEIRGMVLDVARIPMRMNFLEHVSKLFRWYKLNELHLHFNDNQWPSTARNNVDGWNATEAAHRLESESFPSLNKQPFKHDSYAGEYDFYRNVYKNPSYSLADFKKFQTNNNTAGINILAEFDTPGHSAAYSLYAVNNPDHIDYLGKPIHHPSDLEALAINPATHPEESERAKRFVKELLSDYLKDGVLTYDHIHLGVDEYWQKNGNIEAFRQYLNDLNKLVKSKGKTMRTWGALSQFLGKTAVDKDIVFDEWAQYESLTEERIREGYRVVNVPQPFTYVTPGRNHKDIINEQFVYDHWDPTIFNLDFQHRKHAALKGEPLLLGAKGALWGDEHREGIEESDLYDRLEKSLAMIGYKTWNNNTSRSFLDYQKSMEETKLKDNYLPRTTHSEVLVHLNGEHGTHDLSTNGHSITNNGVTTETINGSKWFKFNGDSSLTTDIETLALPYTLEMTIRPTDSNAGSLLLSRDGAIFLNKKGRSQQDGSVIDGLMFNRYFYSQNIRTPLEAGKDYKLTFAATRQVLTVYINDKKVATFAHQNEGGESKLDRNYRTSFNLPFKEIGKGFKGYIKDIKVYNRTSSDEEIARENLEKVNVALHQPVYSMRHNSLFYDQGIRPYHRFKLTDGDIDASDGRWNSSNSDTDYFIVDLKDKKTFSSVELHFDPERLADSFKISVSDDFNTFTDIKTVTNNQAATVTLDVTPQSARYVKFESLKRQAGKNEIAVKEIRLYQPLSSKETLHERFATKDVDVNNPDWLAVYNTLHNKYASSETIATMLRKIDTLRDPLTWEVGSGVTIDELPSIEIPENQPQEESSKQTEATSTDSNKESQPNTTEPSTSNTLDEKGTHTTPDSSTNTSQDKEEQETKKEDTSHHAINESTENHSTTTGEKPTVDPTDNKEEHKVETPSTEKVDKESTDHTNTTTPTETTNGTTEPSKPIEQPSEKPVESSSVGLDDVKNLLVDKPDFPLELLTSTSTASTTTEVTTHTMSNSTQQTDSSVTISEQTTTTIATTPQDATLPATGEQDLALFGIAALNILASVGLITTARKKEN